MRYLTVTEILETYQRVIRQSGGLMGVRDFGALESAAAQPYMTFDRKELSLSGGKSGGIGLFIDSKPPLHRR